MTAGPALPVAATCAEAPATHKGDRGLAHLNKQPGGHHSGRIAPRRPEDHMDNPTFPCGAVGAAQHRTDSQRFSATQR